MTLDVGQSAPCEDECRHAELVDDRRDHRALFGTDYEPTAPDAMLPRQTAGATTLRMVRRKKAKAS